MVVFPALSRPRMRMRTSFAPNSRAITDDHTPPMTPTGAVRTPAPPPRRLAPVAFDSTRSQRASAGGLSSAPTWARGNSLHARSTARRPTWELQQQPAELS
eukprot:GHVT01097508.1.p1 GENE.GHVT01097508.1~~GHVT01097508.1.p1  ORF type:complete len:101 (-),score=16.39 GHVT01097508.1:532-834(-)